MIIRANGKEIQVKSAFGDVLKRNGKTYPALRFEFENEATTEDIEVLLSGRFEILDDNGEAVGVHEGYNTLKSVSVIIGKVTTEEQRIEELEAEKTTLVESLAVIETEKEELQNAINVIVGGNV